MVNLRGKHAHCSFRTLAPYAVPALLLCPDSGVEIVDDGTVAEAIRCHCAIPDLEPVAEHRSCC